MLFPLSTQTLPTQWLNYGTAPTRAGREILKWFGGLGREEPYGSPSSNWQKPAASHCSGRGQEERVVMQPPLTQRPQPNFITKPRFSPILHLQGAGRARARAGGSLCSPPLLLVAQPQFWRQQMGSQDGLRRHLKVRHERQECENLSVGEPLASAAQCPSCWCDFPAGKGRLEQPPSLRGHPRQMARYPFGSSWGWWAWISWIQVATARVCLPAVAAFVQGSKGRGITQTRGFSSLPPLNIKIQWQSQTTKSHLLPPASIQGGLGQEMPFP